MALEQAEHRFDTVATFQMTSGAAIGERNLWIILAVGGKTHDVVPIKVPQFRQVIAVEAGIVGENGMDIVLTQPGTKINDGLDADTQDGSTGVSMNRVLSYILPTSHSMARI